MKHRSQVGTFAGVLVLNFASRLLTLLVSVLLARILGASAYGIYVSISAVLVLLTVPVTLGLPTLIVRLVASYSVRGEWGLIRGLMERANQLVFSVAVIIAVVVGSVIWCLREQLDPLYVDAAWIAVALLPITGLSAVRSAALAGFQHVALGQLPDTLITSGVFIMLVWAWLPSHSLILLPQTPEVAFLFRLVASTIALVIGGWMLIRLRPKALRLAEPQYELKAWIHSVLPLLLLGGLTVVNTQADILMLSAIEGAEAAGLYQAAARGADLVAFFLIVINAAIQPSLSKLYASGDLMRLQRLTSIAARGSIALALPGALVLGLWAAPMLRYAFGPEFEKGAACLQILCAAQLVNAAAGPVALILNMTGHERDVAMGVGCGAIVNLLLNALLIPIWGGAGAAVATGISLAVWNVLLALRVRKRLGIWPTAFGRLGRVNARNIIR